MSGVEEQFYFIFPLLLAFLYPGRLLHDSPPSARKESSGLCCFGVWRCVLAAVAALRRRALVVLTSLLVVSIVSCGVLTARAPTAAYYVLPSRWWQLMAGAVLWIAQDAHPKHAERLPLCACLVIEAAAVVLLTFSLACTPSDHGFPWPWGLVPTAGAVLAIGAGQLPRRRLAGTALHTPLLRSALAHPLLVYIGKISYPLYLWHWPTLVLFRHTVMLASARNMLAAAVIMLAGALLLYHGVEAAVRAWRPRSQWTAPVTLLAAVGAVALMLQLLRDPWYGMLYAM